MFFLLLFCLFPSHRFVCSHYTAFKVLARRFPTALLEYHTSPLLSTPFLNFFCRFFVYYPPFGSLCFYLFYSRESHSRKAASPRSNSEWGMACLARSECGGGESCSEAVRGTMQPQGGIPRSNSEWGMANLARSECGGGESCSEAAGGTMQPQGGIPPEQQRVGDGMPCPERMRRRRKLQWSGYRYNAAARRHPPEQQRVGDG